MSKYHKINSLFKRDMENKGKLIIGDWAMPEFDYLRNNNWVWTEKIDGTNIRIDYNPEVESIDFAGRTDKAIIPDPLYTKLYETFMEGDLFKNFEHPVTLYGEGYGKKIQKGHNYIQDGVDFILFDVKIGRWWFTREAVEGVAKDMGLKVVPIVGEGSLYDAINFVKDGFVSLISDNREYMAEGVVARPTMELSCRNGERIIAKVKTVDYKNI